MYAYRSILTSFINLLILIVFPYFLHSRAQFTDSKAMPEKIQVNSSTEEEYCNYIKRFDEVLNILSENFYNQKLLKTHLEDFKTFYRSKCQNINSEIEFYNLINEMLEELGSSHTRYLTPSNEEYYWLADIFINVEPKIENIFNGKVQYPSLGLITVSNQGKLFVASILPKTPASKSNIKLGDEIISVNDGQYSPVDSLKNHISDQVKLTIKRSKFSKLKDIHLQPLLVNPSEQFLKSQKASTTVYKAGQWNIGYIHIYSYANQKFHENLSYTLTQGKLKHTDGVIIDLRFGLGGADPIYMDLFNLEVPSLQFKDQSGNEYVYDPKWRKPVVFLVNSSTRSGKEILAYSAKKHSLITVVGETTAGAVIGGKIFVLSNKDFLYLGVREVLVDNKNLEKIGVDPDIRVPMEIRYNDGRDVQIEKALEVLENKIKNK